jgi:hypothetical protein
MKRQQAMAVAMVYPEGQKRGPKDANSGKNCPKLGHNYLSQERDSFLSSAWPGFCAW